MRHQQVSSEGRGLPEGDAVDVLGCCHRVQRPNHRNNYASSLIEATSNGRDKATDGQQSTDPA